MRPLGDREYNYVGCEMENKEFDNFSIQSVPQTGMKKRVGYAIRTIENNKND